jgi:putative pyruvate formate lyase activating enzyme
MIDASVLREYQHCMLCPNKCGVDRTKGQRGRCGETDEVRVAWSGLHRGEEPPVTGEKGSGMIFFCGCPLHCAYCQNHQISSYGENVGIFVSIEELASLMLALESFGATNINLVTPTHFYPSIALAISVAREKGLTLPIVNNSSGFESVTGLRLIDPFIDLYLIDVKTLDRDVAGKFCGLPLYADVIVPVMEYLVKKHPRVHRDKRGLRGLLVRHLLFPGTTDATLSFLSWYKEHLDTHAWLSLMVQFVPPEKNPGFEDVSQETYDRLIDKLEELDIDDGFVQDLADNIPWIPDFTRDVPFPASFADPLPLFLKMKASRSSSRQTVHA